MNGGRRLALVLICVILVTACGQSADAQTSSGASSAGPSEPPPSASASASSEPSASSSASGSSSPGTIATWPATADFDSDPDNTYVTDVAAWSGGFVAIGSAWESELRVTGPEMPAIWTSADGSSWERQPVDLGMDNVTLIGVAPRADGRLMLVGRVPGTGEGPALLVAATVSWLSDDAVTWEPAELLLPDDAVVDSFDHGPAGYALTEGGSIWFSPDGSDWTNTYDGASAVVAGEEGFVALALPEAAGPSSVVASGDGQTWFPSESIASPLLDVAALGGDWVAVGYSDASTIMVWHSADGLTWMPTLDVNDLTGPNGPKTGMGLNELAINGASLGGGAGHAFLTLTNNHCCAQMSWNYGVWGSQDGAAWTPVIERDAFVSSVASSDDAIVIGGHLRRGEAAAFWIGGP